MESGHRYENQSSMGNLYDAALSNTTFFIKYKVDDLLFAQYTCAPGTPKTEVWTHHSYFTYVVSGKMSLQTQFRDYMIEEGNSYFVRKGAMQAHAISDHMFCDLIIFIPDDFVFGIIDKHQLTVPPQAMTDVNEFVFPLHLDETLGAYYQSLFSYFTQKKSPNPKILMLKFEELLLNIWMNPLNQSIRNIYAHKRRTEKIPISEIMEANFAHHLSISDFARLCGRSLSTFRRDFLKIYGQPPGKWLFHKRLMHANHLLATTSKSINDICFDCGFTNRSHFSRSFKTKFKKSPQQFRGHKS